MKIGVVCSAGGSAFFSALDMFVSVKNFSISDVYLISDRHCGAIDVARERGIKFTVIEEANNDEFSALASDEFKKFGVDLVFLLFTRLVSSELFRYIPTVNIHPSLLPSFSGFGALDAAKSMKVRFLGATLHMVDETTDSGKIISQVVTPVNMNWTESDYSRVSYLQKTYLLISMMEMYFSDVLRLDAGEQSVTWNSEPEYTFSSNPCLCDEKLSKVFLIHQESCGYEVVSR